MGSAALERHFGAMSGREKRFMKDCTPRLTIGQLEKPCVWLSWVCGFERCLQYSRRRSLLFPCWDSRSRGQSITIRWRGVSSLRGKQSGRKRKRAGASRELRVGHGEKKKIVVEIAVSPLSAAYPRMPRSNDNTSLAFRIISFLDLQVLFLSLESFFVGILWELYM